MEVDAAAVQCTRQGQAMRWVLEHEAVEAVEDLGRARSPNGAFTGPAHLAFVFRSTRKFELPLDAVLPLGCRFNPGVHPFRQPRGHPSRCGGEKRR